MKAEDLEVKKPKEEIKKVEETLMIESTKPAFKLPDGEIVELNAYLVWLGNMIYQLNKKI